MSNFWKKLERPILSLAPMADVTDPAFRRIIAKYSKAPGGAPYVTWTEFVSADGLHHARERLIRDLAFDESQRPIVAQFFTAKPEYMEEASRLAVELGFDGVDINMGCPDRSVEKQGSGASLIRNPKLAQELIYAAKQGAESASRRIPVSVKTRIGYNKNEIETWLPALLEADPAVITLHARTRKEMSKVPAQWEVIKRAVKIRNESGRETLIFGNGDVESVADAYQKVADTGADGAMLGRAIFGNPWLFSNRHHSFSADPRPVNDSHDYFSVDPREVSASPRARSVHIPERLRVLVEHTQLFESLLGNHKSFSLMKKHFKAYVTGFDGARELREELMQTELADEVAKIVQNFLTAK